MSTANTTPTHHLDVLIIGAGLSGIGAACQLAKHNPEKSVAILERRQNIGGTWDLFRYPGIRSDSDMFTFGYCFRPWRQARTLADGAEIRQYIHDTAKAYHVDRKIHFGCKVLSADWNSQTQQWSVQTQSETDGELRSYHCRFLVSCTGYYNYDQGHLPDFPGARDFSGTFFHAQQWPESLDYSDKRVIVIGSGATAVTLVPTMAAKARHVTMLQRSPSYIFSRPAEDSMSKKLLHFLPASWVFRLTRWRNITLQRWLFRSSKRHPERVKRFLLEKVRQQLPSDDYLPHFTPRYNPWDERICAVPDGALFKELRNGQASVVTDTIERFVDKGIQLESGRTLEADIIVAATGLQLQMLGGASISLDGESVKLNEKMAYKGVLIEDLPNFAMMMGYTNLSWTLKVEVAVRYLSRLFKYMDKTGVSVAIPVDPHGCKLDSGIMDSLSSGYVKRSSALTPRQGSQGPWKVVMDYKRDRRSLLRGNINDGNLNFIQPANRTLQKSA